MAVNWCRIVDVADRGALCTRGYRLSGEEKKNVRQSTRQGVVYLPEKLTRVDPLRIKKKFMLVAFRGWHLTCVTNARGGAGEITSCDCWYVAVYVQRHKH